MMRWLVYNMAIEELQNQGKRGGTMPLISRMASCGCALLKWAVVFLGSFSPQETNIPKSKEKIKKRGFQSSSDFRTEWKNQGEGEEGARGGENKQRPLF